MLEVKTNKEILKIRNRIYFGFTLYQVLFFALGIVTGGILYVALPFADYFKVPIMIVVVGFFSVIGFFEFNNKNLLKLFFLIAKNRKICREPMTVRMGVKEMRKDVS